MTSLESAQFSSHERREFIRRSETIKVEVRVGNYREVLETRNVAVGGLCLATDGARKLPVRTIVCLTEEGKETLLGRIVWVSDDGMGVEYLERPADCCKPTARPTDA